jgi:hypothetical protein
VERVSKGACALFALAFALASCGTIWGFEDALDRDPAAPEGGAGGAWETGTGPAPDTGTSPDTGVGADPDADAPDSDASSTFTEDGGDDSIVPAPNAPGVSCVPPAPLGWQGPLAIVEVTGTPLPTSPSCLSGYKLVYDGNAEPDAPAGACTCSCTPPSLASLKCASPTGTFYSDPTCLVPCSQAQTVPTPPATNSGCQAFSVLATCATTKYVKVEDAVPTGGSCTAVTNGTPKPLSWNKAVRLCGPAGVTATCPGTKVPIVTPVLPYDPGNFCIVSRSDQACPTAYPQKRTYFDSDKVTDTRGCGTCSCGAVKGTCGGGMITIDTPASCSGGVTNISVPAGCATVKSSNKGWGYTAPGTPSNVSCEGAGGGPTGTFHANAPINICCRH